MSEVNLRGALEIAENPTDFFNRQDNSQYGVEMLCEALETLVESWHAHHLLVHALVSQPVVEGLEWTPQGNDKTLAEGLRAFLDNQHKQMEQMVHPMAGRKM